MMHLLNSALLFLSVICLATLCGLGLLKLCGLQAFRQRILLAPSMALSVSGILVAFIVLLGIPVGSASFIVWLFWIVFAVYGAIHVRSALIDLECRHILWISILVTLLVSGGFFWYGLSDYLGSPALDGWSYVSFGEYLRQYPKGVEGGLAPIYQYAAHLSDTRYVASAMLAVLIPPWSVGVDTQMTVGPLLILSIFSFALSVAYATQIANQRGLDTPVCLAVFFGVVGGWLPHALHVNNYDNLLALPLAPALFALASDRNLNRTGQIFLPAIFIAASIYIYPELSPLILTAYGVVAVEFFFSCRFGYENETNKRIQFFKYALIAVIVLVIVSPYLQNFMRFFSGQWSSTTKMSGRPGEGQMPSLMDSMSIWGAMWGLGNYKIFGIIVGFLIGQIALFGALTAIAKRCFSIILYLAIISALFVVMVTLEHYDYGAYKILLLGWWAIAIVLSAGAKGVWSAVPSYNRVLQNYLKIAIITIFLGATSLWLTQQYIWVYKYTYKTATETREVRDVLKNRGTVQVSVSDPMLNAWLVYQLRDAKVLFTEFHGYMDQLHVRPFMARSMALSPNEIHYLLTDVNKFTVGDIVWKNDVLKVIKGTPGQQPPDIAIYAPNGQEIVEGMPFFWIGREPASIVLTTPKPTIVQVDFEATVGPNVSPSTKDYPNVFVEYSNKQLFVFNTQSARKCTVRITLSPGMNTLIFRQDYTGDVVSNNNGDPRILLVGIKLVNVIVDD